jgi:hypothetical protein
MVRLLDDEVEVHYGQIYVGGELDELELSECFAGQQNGLCGAAVPGCLFLITGLHTGPVGFAVELYDGPPPLDETWEEIVEVSFGPAEPVALISWAGEQSWPLDLPAADYRVRYCGTQLDQANDKDTRLDDEPQIDRYLLQFWPGRPEPDRVVKQTSKQAAYWHESVR